MLLEQGDMDSFLVLLNKAPKSADTRVRDLDVPWRGPRESQRLEAAAEHFRKAIELNPTVPKYYYRLAMAEERLGLRTQALAHLERTKEMNEARASCRPPMRTSSLPRTPRARLAAAASTCPICDTLGWLGPPGLESTCD